MTYPLFCYVSSDMQDSSSLASSPAHRAGALRQDNGSGTLFGRPLQGVPPAPVAGGSRISRRRVPLTHIGPQGYRKSQQQFSQADVLETQ